MSNENETFEVEGWDNQPPSNVLETNRYKFKVVNIEPHVSAGKGNQCNKVTLDVEGHRVTDFLILKDVNGKPHSMSYKWRQFLYSIGIRNPGRSFVITKDKIIGGVGLVDIVKESKPLDSGITVFENKVRYYAPIDKDEAPIAGVEPESEEQKSEPEKKPKPKQEKKEEPKEEEDDEV